MIEVALKYNSFGLDVLALRSDKSPTQKTWNTNRQDQNDVRSYFNSKTEKIGIITHSGLEAIDFDVKNYHKDGDIVKEYGDYAKKVFKAKDLLERLVVQRTPSKGVHLIYRSPVVEGNQKLAANPSNQAFIETRGKKGYIVAAPSEGYKLVRNDFGKIPELTVEERDKLIVAARCFDYSRKKKKYTDEERQVLKEQGGMSWQCYDLLDDVLEVLEENGWREVEKNGEWIHYTRPGTKSGDVHASYNLEQHYFNVFTTSDSVLDARGYSPSALYTYLECCGDFPLACRQLHNDGYGNITGEVKELSEVERLMLEVKQKRFDYSNKPKKEDTILNCTVDSVNFQVANFKNIVGVVGKKKSRKTTFLTTVCSSALMDGKTILNFSLNLRGKKMVYFDTEQPEYFFYTQLKRMHDMAGVNQNISSFQGYQLRKYSVTQRLLIINQVLSSERNVGCVVLDGIVDLCTDFMDSKASRDTIEKIMTWTDLTGALFLVVLHLTKANGYVRGHLGSELENKADSIIEIEKDAIEDFSTVKSRDARFKDFPSFEFEQDENGLPMVRGSESAEINIQEQMNRTVDTRIEPRREELTEGQMAALF